MAFACYARFARCRAAHLSQWARRTNFEAFGGHRRGLVSAPLLRACAECRPALSFPEQHNAGSSLVTDFNAGDALSDSESISVLIDGLTQPGGIQLAEMLGANIIRWVSYPSSEKCNRIMIPTTHR
mmetsp:Transcript_30670/g.60186  ORF Transcript_30670/g.60186 Transcript_30670/m.60186 type:complete len:126 (-) Transcript_30670:145-522(-)